jgi:hypothetical protein
VNYKPLADLPNEYLFSVSFITDADWQEELDL